MISHEVAARARNQRDQLLYQFVRREHDSRSAISPGLLEAQSKPTVGQFLQTVVRDRRPCQVSAEMLEAVAVIGTHAHVRVNIETGDLRASLAYDRGLGILAGPPMRNTRQFRRGPVATRPCTEALARWSRVSCWSLSSPVGCPR